MKQSHIAFSILALGCIAWATPTLADPGRGATILCYLWANQASPTIGVPYEPSPTYSFDAQNRAGAISVTKTATGTYSATCGGVGGKALWGPGGHVQVSAYGDGAKNTCHVGSWSTGGTDFVATVNCFGPTFAPTDSQFDLLFVW
ncbi:MAG: hypothetical protein WA624_04820 [Methylocella sp.]